MSAFVKIFAPATTDAFFLALRTALLANGWTEHKVVTGSSATARSVVFKGAERTPGMGDSPFAHILTVEGTSTVSGFVGFKTYSDYDVTAEKGMNEAGRAPIAGTNGYLRIVGAANVSDAFVVIDNQSFFLVSYTNIGGGSYSDYWTYVGFLDRQLPSTGWGAITKLAQPVFSGDTDIPVVAGASYYVGQRLQIVEHAGAIAPANAGAVEVVTVAAGTTPTNVKVALKAAGTGLLTGLVSYYKLDNATDELAVNNGTATDVNFGSGGKIGFAAQFNGSTSSIDLGTSSTLNFTAMTFSAWVKMVDRTTYYMIATRGPSGADNYQFRIETITGQLVFTHAASIITGAPVPIDGRWHHVAFTRAAGSTVNLYLDGIPAALAGGITPTDTPTATTFLGKRLDGFPFKGEMDEVGFWNRELTSTEIWQLYRYGAGWSHPFPAYGVANDFSAGATIGENAYPLGVINSPNAGLGFFPYLCFDGHGRRFESSGLANPTTGGFGQRVIMPANGNEWQWRPGARYTGHTATNTGRLQTSKIPVCIDVGSNALDFMGVLRHCQGSWHNYAWQRWGRLRDLITGLDYWVAAKNQGGTSFAWVSNTEVIAVGPGADASRPGGDYFEGSFVAADTAASETITVIENTIRIRRSTFIKTRT